jgi:hypothetical protein
MSVRWSMLAETVYPDNLEHRICAAALQVRFTQFFLRVAKT